MALNFPDPAAQTPVNTFSPSSTPSASTNGITYLWDGQKWNAQTNSDAAFWQRVGTTLSPATVGDNISTTGDLTTADATVNTLTSNGLVTASSGTFAGDVQVGSLNSGPLAGFRNQLINGDFRVWQRGTSFNLPAGAANNAYTADRWYTANGVQCRQFDANAPAGFTNCWNHQSGAGNVGQLIEVDDTNGKQDRFADGTTWTMSVWSTADLTDGNHNFTAQWAESPLANTTQIATGAWTAAGESSNGFNRYRFTFTINTAIGASQSVLHVFWIFPSENAWYAGAQLEPGPVASPYEVRPIQTELALCQRYFQKVKVPQGSMTGTYMTPDAFYAKTMSFPVQFRATPTAGTPYELVAQFKWVDPGTSTFSSPSTANVSYFLTESNWGLRQIRAGTGSSGPVKFMTYQLEAGFSVNFDAEL